VVAGVFAANIDRRATSGAADDLNLFCHFLDFGAIELADEAFFRHEGREGVEAAVLSRAAVVGEVAIARAVEAVPQPFVTARALQDVSPGLALVVVVLVQQPEEFEDAGRGQLGTLEVIEPDALAGKTDIERDFAMQLALEAVGCHGRATGGAKSTAGRMGVRGGGVGHNSKSQ
jgi:hypothetical protein